VAARQCRSSLPSYVTSVHIVELCVCFFKKKINHISLFLSRRLPYYDIRVVLIVFLAASAGRLVLIVFLAASAGRLVLIVFLAASAGRLVLIVFLAASAGRRRCSWQPVSNLPMFTNEPCQCIVLKIIFIL